MVRIIIFIPLRKYFICLKEKLKKEFYDML